MLDFSQVRQVIIEPHIQKFTFNYCILSTLNVFPKEINLVILELQFNKMINTIIKMEDDEKMSLLLQIVGMDIYHHKENESYEEKKIIEFILTYLSHTIYNNKDIFSINFNIVGQTLMSKEMILIYHDIDKNYLKVKNQSLPFIRNFLFNNPINMIDIIESNMKSMFNTKKKYLIHIKKYEDD